MRRPRSPILNHWAIRRLPASVKRRMFFAPPFSGSGDVTPVLSSISDNNAAENRVIDTAEVGTVVGITAFAFHSGYAVSYSLSDDAGGLFQINSSTGVVTVADALSIGGYTITVLATSSEGATESRVFAITVYADG